MAHVIHHEVHDPFLYIETADGNHVAIKTLEVARMQEVAGLTVHALDELGYDEFTAAGDDPDVAELKALVRACTSLEISEAVVPPEFPTELADALRASGLTLHTDRKLFAMRRRVKSGALLKSVRRAVKAAEAGLATVATELANATVGANGGLMREGQPLTCEFLQEQVRIAFLRNGATDAGIIVAHGEQTCIGHHAGSGQVFEGEPVTVDICPKDTDGGGCADLTRTFVVGPIDDKLQRYFALVQESLEKTYAALKPGVTAAELHAISCQPMIDAGEPTQLTKEPGKPNIEGYFHSLGHGVGIEVHEAPSLNQNPEAIVAGDVLALEPGCYQQGFGGVRLEDNVLVTEEGYEILCDYPYDLTPVATTRGR